MTVEDCIFEGNTAEPLPERASQRVPGEWWCLFCRRRLSQDPEAGHPECCDKPMRPLTWQRYGPELYAALGEEAQRADAAQAALDAAEAAQQDLVRVAVQREQHHSAELEKWGGKYEVAQQALWKLVGWSVLGAGLLGFLAGYLLRG